MLVQVVPSRAPDDPHTLPSATRLQGQVGASGGSISSHLIGVGDALQFCLHPARSRSLSVSRSPMRFALLPCRKRENSCHWSLILFVLWSDCGAKWLLRVSGQKGCRIRQSRARPVRISSAVVLRIRSTLAAGHHVAGKGFCPFQRLRSGVSSSSGKRLRADCASARAVYISRLARHGRHIGIGAAVKCLSHHLDLFRHARIGPPRQARAGWRPCHGKNRSKTFCARARKPCHSRRADGFETEGRQWSNDHVKTTINRVRHPA